jgi:hypothetical protein
MLRLALSDKEDEIRRVAAEALMEIAVTGNDKAVDAVMSDVQTILSHGLGMFGAVRALFDAN